MRKEELQPEFGGGAERATEVRDDRIGGGTLRWIVMVMEEVEPPQKMVEEDPQQLEEIKRN